MKEKIENILLESGYKKTILIGKDAKILTCNKLEDIKAEEFKNLKLNIKYFFHNTILENYYSNDLMINNTEAYIKKHNNNINDIIIEIIDSQIFLSYA